MSQGEILKFLQDNPGKFFSSKEISDEIGTSLGNVCQRLKRLRDFGEVRWKKDKIKYIYAYIEENAGSNPAVSNHAFHTR